MGAHEFPCKSASQSVSVCVCVCACGLCWCSHQANKPASSRFGMVATATRFDPCKDAEMHRGFTRMQLKRERAEPTVLCSDVIPLCRRMQTTCWKKSSHTSKHW